MIDVHYANLTSQGVQHRVFYLDGHPSRYQPRPTELNFGEQTGTGVFPLVIAVPSKSGNEFHLSIYLCQKENFNILVLEKGFQMFLLFLDLVLARENDK